MALFTSLVVFADEDDDTLNEFSAPLPSTREPVGSVSPAANASLVCSGAMGPPSSRSTSNE